MASRVTCRGAARGRGPPSARVRHGQVLPADPALEEVGGEVVLLGQVRRRVLPDDVVQVVVPLIRPFLRPLQGTSQERPAVGLPGELVVVGRPRLLDVACEVVAMPGPGPVLPPRDRRSPELKLPDSRLVDGKVARELPPSLAEGAEDSRLVGRDAHRLEPARGQTLFANVVQLSLPAGEPRPSIPGPRPATDVAPARLGREVRETMGVPEIAEQPLTSRTRPSGSPGS